MDVVYFMYNNNYLQICVVQYQAYAAILLTQYKLLCMLGYRFGVEIENYAYKTNVAVLRIFLNS